VSEVQRVLAAAAVLAVVLAAAGCGSHYGPPRGLTAFGRTEWNFEALLRDTFGGGSDICLDAEHPAVGYTDRVPCPMSSNGPYIFFFANARESEYHLARRRFPVNAHFGAHSATPVRVAGNLVACDRRERHLLLYTAVGIFCSEVP
jgi:hypothetical protein